MNRLWIQRWPILLTMLAALLSVTSGCAGGAGRASSWTGLTVAEETLYAADLQQIVALDAEEGNPVWTFPKQDQDQGMFYITPAVGDGLVIGASQLSTGGIISQQDDIVWALDRETGEEVWRFEGAAGRYVEGGALSNGLFVIGNDDGNIYALDAESGNLRWSFKTGDSVWATPLIVGDTVYVGSMDRHFYALTLDTGRKKWDFVTKGAFAGTPAWLDGTLYIGAFDDTFYALDGATGEEKWQAQGANWFWGSPVIDDGTVYAVDVDGNVYALDATSGEERWREALEAPVRAGGVLSDDGTRLFIGSENGTLYTLDTDNGSLMWRNENEGRVLSTPVVNGSTVYKPLIYGPHRVVAVHIDNGRDMWVYPQVEEEQE